MMLSYFFSISKFDNLSETDGVFRFGRFGLSIYMERLGAIFFSQNLFIFISSNRMVIKNIPFILIYGTLALED